MDISIYDSIITVFAECIIILSFNLTNGSYLVL